MKFALRTIWIILGIWLDELGSNSNQLWNHLDRDSDYSPLRVPWAWGKIALAAKDSKVLKYSPSKGFRLVSCMPAADIEQRWQATMVERVTKEKQPQ